MPSLHWIGKEKVVNHHQDVPYKILEHQYSFSASAGEQKGVETGSGNKIIHGDNLEALKSLLPQYEGQIKCIYIDPPYNTGSEDWAYNDNVNDPKIKKWLHQVVGKEGEDLSRHDKWLCMMYPRIKLLHKLLAEDGSIFISIDDNEQTNLKLLLNEIFGQGNFLGTIVWKKKTNGNNVGHIPSVHDYFIVYAKDEKKLNFPGIPFTEEYIEENFSNPDNDPQGLWTTQDLSANHVGPYFPITNLSTNEIHYPPEGRYWVFNEVDVLKRIDEGRIIFGKSGKAKPVQKIYFKEKEGKGLKPETWLGDHGLNSDGMKELSQILGTKKFDHPKPSAVLKHLIKFATSHDDIILDSFAGSGTTAHAILELNKEEGSNRSFILIEMMDYAEEITSNRVKKVIQGYSYKGKRKIALLEKSLSKTTLKNGMSIIDKLEQFENNDKGIENIKLEFKNKKVLITGEKSSEDSMPGTGGDFNYYVLGIPVFDEDANLNENVIVDKIREYIYYSETKHPLVSERFLKLKDNKYLLGKHNETAYYFYYEKQNLTTLDNDFLSTIKIKAGQYIIYADNCLLDKVFMQKKNIIFKKIPRDITRF